MKSRDTPKNKRTFPLVPLVVMSTALLLSGYGCASKANEGAAPELRVPEPTPAKATARDPGPQYLSPAYTPPPPSGPIPQNVPPTLLEQYRLAGTQVIEPSAATRDVIAKSGRRAITSVKMCLDATGAVEKPTLLKSSGYPDYDNLIIDEITASWRFRPYEVNGTVTRVCTAATFIYPKAEPAPTISSDTEPEHDGGYWCIRYAVGGVVSSGCSTDADYCENFAGTQAALQKWGMSDRSGCEWQETAWHTRVSVEKKKEDWYFMERSHCEESILRGTRCKQATNRGTRKRTK